MSISASANWVVWIARSSSDSWTMLGLRSASFIRRPASIASFTPRSLSGTSVQPVKRFSRFHVLSPWRSRIRMPVLFPPHSWGGVGEADGGAQPRLAMTVYLRSNLHDLRELFRVQACPTDQDAVAQRQLDVLLHVVRLHAAAVEDAH